MRQLIIEQPSSEYRHQAEVGYDDRALIKNNTETWLAEVLNGSMQTSFDFHFKDEDIISQSDGSSLRKIFDSSVEEAYQITNVNPGMMFELRRRMIEKEEFNEIVQMMKGELPNTMVVVSDFPNELTQELKDVAGYNVKRQATILRVIKKVSEDHLIMVSQSLDGSYRPSLEAIYQSFGGLAKNGELLGQRLHLNFDDHLSASFLTDYIREIYDSQLGLALGGRWYAGIRQHSISHPTNTYDFVKQQSDIVNLYVDDYVKDPIKAEDMRLGIAALVSQRFNVFLSSGRNISYKEEKWQSQAQQYAFISPFLINQNLYNDISQAAQRAVVSGNESYSGCGITVSINSYALDDNEYYQLGYGNKIKKSEEYSFNDYGYCIKCQKNPKEKEKKKQLGPCAICRDCDPNFKIF